MTSLGRCYPLVAHSRPAATLVLDAAAVIRAPGRESPSARAALARVFGLSDERRSVFACSPRRKLRALSSHFANLSLLALAQRRGIRL